MVIKQNGFNAQLGLSHTQSLLYHGSLMILCWRLTLVTLLDLTSAVDIVDHKTFISNRIFCGHPGN